jgi:hypothetical protein
MRLLLVLLAAALLAPGCATPASRLAPASAAQAPVRSWADVRAAMAGVPCAPDADTHGTTPNLRALAHVAPDDEYSPAFHAELTVREDERGVFALHTRTLAGGFDVLDLRDPLDPRWIAAWEPKNASQALDAKISTDGATAVVGSAGQLILVDIRDLLHPEEIGRWDFPAGHPGIQGHMLALHRIGGADYVFAATQFDYGVWILRLAGPPSARSLEPVATFALGLNGPIGPHDQVVIDDPMRGNAPTMYVANGFLGWLAADVSDPAQPKLLGGALAADPSDYAHSIAVAFVNGHRLVVTSSEAGFTALKVYDATNLLLPVLVAQWKDDLTNPLAVQHNVEVLGSRLYMTHYERGVFVFDLASVPTGLPLVGSTALKPVAHFSVGNKTNSNFVPFFLAGGDDTLSGVLDVVAHDGVLLVATIFDGLHVVGDGCLAPGDPQASTPT